MNRKLTSAIAAASLAVVITACATSEPLTPEQKAAVVEQYGVLSEAALQAEIVGNSMMGQSKKFENEWIEFYDSSGAIRGKWTDGSENWSGKWTTNGPLFCFDYEGSADDQCVMIQLTGDQARFLKEDGTDDTESTGVSVLKGNPQGL